MSDTKTVYNPNTGEDHLIDCQTGLETVPEKTEEEIRQEMLEDIQELTKTCEPLDLVNETFGKYDEQSIIEALESNYNGWDFANEFYDLSKETYEQDKEIKRLKKIISDMHEIITKAGY